MAKGEGRPFCSVADTYMYPNFPRRCNGISAELDTNLCSSASSTSLFPSIHSPFPFLESLLLAPTDANATSHTTPFFISQNITEHHEENSVQ
ncbi:unnamed protein product [Periconia digitata]|uniref:Uncharacterized protein n=1 Tax=Periconia digitata TaxID=1303443 RepID=A0A9W4XMX6_9PLEO|nr:unnamed protein product [Periconia digitata]